MQILGYLRFNRFNVFSHSLKTNITIHLALLLVIAMILINFVMIIVAQKALLNSEISKGYVFLSGIRENFFTFTESENTTARLDYQDNFSRRLNDAGISCALVMEEHKNEIYSTENNCALKEELESLTKQTIASGKKTTRFFGSTWGVFWEQSKNLIISTPFLNKGRIVAGASIVLPLERIYKTLRQTQYLLLIYVFVNTAVLTLIGLYRLTKITVKPLQKLVKRADEYREDGEMFFLYEKGDNEFGKLSKALNSMLKKIAEDKEKLQNTILSLEKANLDLKQAQKEIVRAEKLASVGRLSSGIAHEIGNPIGIIGGYLELLKQNDISDGDKKEFILRTENEIKRINTIIRELLDFSKPSSEGLKSISVHEIIQDTIDVFKFQPLIADINLNLSLKAENDTVRADPNQLRQIFLNLIINAADAISSVKNRLDGNITVTSEVVPSTHAKPKDHLNMLKINYIDNGIGIAEESLGDIFDPFYTTKEPGKGTGLGLSVCFMIVEEIGGEIKADSKEGKGTTMTLYLPLHDDSPPEKI